VWFGGDSKIMPHYACADTPQPPNFGEDPFYVFVQVFASIPSRGHYLRDALNVSFDE